MGTHVLRGPDKIREFVREVVAILVQDGQITDVAVLEQDPCAAEHALQFPPVFLFDGNRDAKFSA